MFYDFFPWLPWILYVLAGRIVLSGEPVGHHVSSGESGGVGVPAAGPILGKLDDHNFPQARE